jgi:1,4-alpha-glucan branching enzyme
MKKIVLLALVILLNSCFLSLIQKRLEPPHKVSAGILFQYEAPSARMVTLAGDFPDNLWGGTAGSAKSYDPNIDLLNDEGVNGDKVAGDGIWSIVKKIEPGRYQYKFVIDRNTWVTDPNALETTDDGYGGRNSVIIVK